MGELRRSGSVASVAVACALCASVLPFAHSSAAATGGHCSRQAADQVVLRLHLEADPGDQTPTAQVLCGVLLLGPGVEAMAASVAVPGCGMTGDWIVLRYQGGSWQLVFESHNGAVIAAVGSDVKETQNVLRPSDPHCFPTGGTRSRVWHWNGSRLVSNGPWRYSKPQAKAPVEAVDDERLLLLAEPESRLRHSADTGPHGVLLEPVARAHRQSCL